jgi:hypothetical protein
MNQPHRGSNLDYCYPKDVIKRQQYYIDLLKPQYNILKTAGSFTGYKHTEESARAQRATIRPARRDESKLKNSLSQSKRVKIEVIDLKLKLVIIPFVRQLSL